MQLQRPALNLLSSMATRELLAELAQQYTREFSQTLSTEASGGVEVAKRVRSGEALDIVVLASNVIDALITEGRLLQGSRVDLVSSGVAMAMREGARKPDVGTEDAVRSAVLAASTLSYSTGPSGSYLEKLFQRWNIMDEIKSRIVVPPPGIPVGSLVASGRVELGFQQLSELKNLPGIEVIGPLPSAIQLLTVFSGGISVTCRAPEAAREVLRFLGSGAVAEAKRRHGMDEVAKAPV